jgi:hypothetical protein
MMKNNKEKLIIFSNYSNKKTSLNVLKNKIIENLKNIEKILPKNTYIELKKNLLPYLKNNNTVKVYINNDNYRIEINNLQMGGDNDEEINMNYTNVKPKTINYNINPSNDINDNEPIIDIIKINSKELFGNKN